ncbi:MAG: ABC transporter ATP-binding protein, partial [Gammaproteobacteria bacterium]|nr:ABC transporter ATP-binding protein [Gammaproteobacteria bacterium]
VGKNGSGKSTLLRIISGIVKPDMGLVEIQGRVAPLIALGAGFNPVLTGRENIYANMSILGLSTSEINERLDEVLEFAEIGDALDAPVQSYSSGMQARLGFSTAVYTDPEILLIDEVLAVGDIRFREKCHRRLQELRRAGTSFILVSHNNHEISNVCEQAILLSQGKIITSGSTFSVIEKYEEELFPKNMDDAEGIFLRQKSTESMGVDIVSLFFRDAQGNISQSPVSGEEVELCIECQVHRYTQDINVYVLIETRGEYILNLSTFHDGLQLPDISVGYHELRMRMPFLGLQPGIYKMEVYVKEGSFFTLDLVESFKFEVKGKHDVNRNLFYQPHSWDIVSRAASVKRDSYT